LTDIATHRLSCGHCFNIGGMNMKWNRTHLIGILGIGLFLGNFAQAISLSRIGALCGWNESSQSIALRFYVEEANGTFVDKEYEEYAGGNKGDQSEQAIENCEKQAEWLIRDFREPLNIGVCIIYKDDQGILLQQWSLKRYRIYPRNQILSLGFDIRKFDDFEACFEAAQDFS